MGPDGFAAVLDVIASPSLRQRPVIMQDFGLALHLMPIGHIGHLTIAGQGDPNFRINCLRAAPVFIKCLEDPDPLVQRWAGNLLSISDPGAAVPALTNYLAGSPAPDFRRTATDALWRHGADSREVVPSLLSRCGDSDPEIRAEATNAVEQINPNALGRAPAEVRP